MVATAEESIPELFRAISEKCLYTGNYHTTSYGDGMYNEKKMRELVLFIADESSEDRSFGRTKLRKLLYFVDHEVYLRRGQTITGARYCKKQHGPVPDELESVETELLASRNAVNQIGAVGPYRQERLVALRPADLDAFDPEEIEIAREVLREHASRSAVQISNLSHDEIGWVLAHYGEEIPTHSYRVSPKLSDDGRQRATQLIEELVVV